MQKAEATWPSGQLVGLASPALEQQQQQQQQQCIYLKKYKVSMLYVLQIAIMLHYKHAPKP